MACKFEFFITLALTFATLSVVVTGDADITSDFIIPANTITLDGNFFTFTGMRNLFGADFPKTFKVTKASMAEFPALNGESVSFAVLQYPADSVNPPHSHPRAAELLFLLDGCLEVGIVDTTNKLFSQKLGAGDMFVFPKGLVHFQYNYDAKKVAIAVSAFGSASAGTASIPGSVFNTSIDSTILAKSFKTDVATIEKIKSGFGAKA